MGRFLGVFTVLDSCSGPFLLTTIVKHALVEPAVEAYLLDTPCHLQRHIQRANYGS